MSRLYDQLRYANYADAVQQGELVKLIERASLTEFGRKYHFSKMRTYREFASTVPLYRYEDLRPQIMRMVSGEANVLWRGKCFNFAQSSGTTDGKKQIHTHHRRLAEDQSLSRRERCGVALSQPQSHQPNFQRQGLYFWVAVSPTNSS
ncbi:MAG: GH3 auxin-responsive promoter family protein [Porphyromonadaceae bacterium]|nr:MAG: GH3 auxin-responsive promoter family protein [Porphyromonadaceae bacterium]